MADFRFNVPNDELQGVFSVLQRTVAEIGMHPEENHGRLVHGLIWAIDRWREEREVERIHRASTQKKENRRDD